MAVDQFTPLFKRFRRYFLAYGRWPAVFGSPLFLASVGISILGYGYWWTPKWVELCFALIPSLLGFSLGTYAILFSLITNRMRRALKALKNSEGVSYLDELNATFFHFIVVQVLSLFLAFLFGGSPITAWKFFIAKEMKVYAVLYDCLYYTLSFLGMVVLVYSVALILGAALAVYRLASITDPSAD